MVQIPEKYLNDILKKAEVGKNISQLINYFLGNTSKNIHFIIDEKEIDIIAILCSLCQSLNGINMNFTYKIGQKVISLPNQNAVYKISAINPEPVLTDNNTTKTPRTLNKYIPLSNSSISQIGSIKNRIIDFKEHFDAENPSDFFNNEKLLVVGNRNLFLSIPKGFPSCFVSENENEITEIEYNSPLLPKISVLKNINLLDNYREKEINGDQLNFTTCIFVGNSKFENSINNIRNIYNQQKFKKAVFIGDKDLKIDLGNNQIPLRWKWTIPEILFFNNKRNIQHKSIIIQNDELENAIIEFYQAIREVEIRHTIGLQSIYRFIRRLYYDWNLNQETTITKLHLIQLEFEIALKQLLIETLGNIFYDFDVSNYLIPISKKFAAIIHAIKSNNKYEKLKSYPTKIQQLVLPSFLCNAYKAELNQIFNKSQNKTSIQGFQELSKLDSKREINSNNSTRHFYSLTANQIKTEIVSLAKSDDTNVKEHKIISSIYGSGKVERLIERLAKAKSEYNLLLYSIEEKAMKHHVDHYISELNREYISQDRFEISGVPFSDNYFQFTSFDELIDALASTKFDYRETENYRIIFNDSSKLKLPSSKSVLKIIGNEKTVVLVEDLSVGDKVFIYANPDKKLLRDIIELKNPDLIKDADKYSKLWRKCLNEAYQNNIMCEPLFNQLVNNHFSVSELTFRKYIEGEVMFPRSFSDLIVIAKTINDSRLSFDFLKNIMKPKIEEYRGKEIEYGFKFSNSINHFIISGEEDEFISEWLTKKEIEEIVIQIPTKTI